MLPALSEEPRKMKALLTSLVIAALCLRAVCSLTCYTCLNESSNSKCLTPTNCSDSDTYCRTSVQRAGFGALSYVSITKACASFCTESNVNSAFVGYSVSCCRADLCNVSGATSEKTSFLVLLASAGFIVTLLRAGL
ncbi:lymphocyte antigen 6E-like isoform X1 [Rhinatrema bivittatum]|uniref:lymphocyte antigen 6E-like isoform X1 n=1 Tax=Rhinatrema bivittatum TaxID=194408 RepID=UPI00112BE6A5|nr:lymphocyte antigen 6E-like isoform X1 [Rhinatrema bivittatum]